jgi:phasin
MRDAADKSVEQARKSFDDFIDATQKAVAKAENSAKTLRQGAADVNRQALALAEENVAASFDLAHRLVRARTVEEVALIQQEFVQRQLQNLTEQGKSLGEMIGRAATTAADKAKK